MGPILIIVIAALLPAVSGSCNITHHFTCLKDGTCIDQAYRCDKKLDCALGEDEENCTEPCANNMFTCNNKACLNWQLVCDGKVQCADESDEGKAPCAARHEHFGRFCKKDEFLCKSGDGCVDSAVVCDSRNDCQDGSDETDCKQQKSCQYRCPAPPGSSGSMNSTCLHLRQICDGKPDCPGGADESACRPPCPKETHRECGPDSHQCVPRTYWCDKHVDCVKGEDEKDCPKDCSWDEFKCDSLQQCVPTGRVCDGHKDCHDGSDERSCPNRPLIQPNKCDPVSEFSCGAPSYECINVMKVCNDVRDCPNGNDERGRESADNCHGNPCSNSNCHHRCANRLGRAQCLCYPGYRLSPADNRTCVDINECTWGVCSQICENREGSFECLCESDYVVVRGDRTRCQTKEGHPELLYTTKGAIRIFRPAVNEMTLPVIASEGQQFIALDYGYNLEKRQTYIFWSQLYPAAIRMAIFDMEVDQMINNSTLVETDISSVISLAYEWNTRNLYWIDSTKKTVGVVNVASHKQAILFQAELVQPVSLVVSPKTRHLFWIDKYEIYKPMIVRAGMDGSSKKRWITRDLLRPSTLTLDIVLERLFWIDVTHRKIECILLNGGDRRTIGRLPPLTKYPFSASVFQDALVWSDIQKQGKIFWVDKFRGNRSNEYALTGAMTVHQLHKVAKKGGYNACAYAKCQHLCLASPTQGKLYTCVCPQDWIPDGDSCKQDPAQLYRTTASYFNIFQSESWRKSSQHRSTSMSSRRVAGLTAGIGFVILLVGLIVYAAIRHRRAHQGAARALNFENPVYKKPKEAVEDEAVNNDNNDETDHQKKSKNSTNEPDVYCMPEDYEYPLLE